MLQRPLPFFLEYPYRHFRKEDDFLAKVRAGQRLLGVLAKVPLYLVVEELLAKGHGLGREILASLEERPPSDGALVALQKPTAKKLAELAVSPLSIFHRLQLIMSDTKDLDAMVTARNRMQHEPYDDEGFLRTMGDRAPKIIDALRDAVNDCRFLIPTHGKVLDASKFVEAEDICSPDEFFRKIQLKVTLPLEQFPSGQLLVWKDGREEVLLLGALLTSRLVHRQIRDFGIFDRVEKMERRYTFLRTLEND